MPYSDGPICRALFFIIRQNWELFSLFNFIKTIVLRELEMRPFTRRDALGFSAILAFRMFGHSLLIYYLYINQPRDFYAFFKYVHTYILSKDGFLSLVSGNPCRVHKEMTLGEIYKYKRYCCMYFYICTY